ncbi:MAG: hypothetical protein ABSH47_17305 [Bryobacteraceae bacterium]
MAYRILAGILLYLVLPVIWVSLGTFMVLAPVRFARFIHENFVLLPQIGPRDTGWKLLIRVIGAGLLAFAVRFVWKAAQLFW